MAPNSKLFSEFAPTSKKEWIDKAIADLKGADFDKKLVWKTDEGFSVQPFYTAEDLQMLDTSAFISENTSRSWKNYISLNGDDELKANQLALKLKDFDIQGILFNISKPKVNFSTLLKGIDPTKINISFVFTTSPSSQLEAYFSYLEKSSFNLSEIKGFAQYDPLEKWITEGIIPDYKELAGILKISSKAKGFKSLTITSNAFVNAGCSVVQELSFTLNKLTDLVDQLVLQGIPYEDLAKELHFHLTIGGNYFFEIAKIRAFKVIAKEVISCYDIKDAEISVLSSSSIWSTSLFDSNVNMLRNTTEAMSAILGGTDELLIYPHDAGIKDSTEFSHRIALNISALLKEESYFDKVVDPSAGSYYIEEITKEIADKSIQLFQQIENEGGFIKSFTAGNIQKLIAQIRTKKEGEYASRKRVIVGTNKYPDQKEKELKSKSQGTNASQNGLQLLAPQRMSKGFDEMRMATLQSEKTPKVLLACFGNLTMRKARASFSSEFFGTAGFELLGEFFYEDMEKGAEDASNIKADIVVLCSSDDEYLTEGMIFAKAFKKKSPKSKLIVAGYPIDHIDTLQKAGVDSFIHMKTNVIEFISELQSELI